MPWIKVETNTPDKPEIRHIAKSCGVTVDAAFMGWFRLWVWLDSETADGHVRLCSPEDCDAIARLPGIGRALADAGWLEFSDAGMLVLGWEKHNGAGAKRRAVDAKRQDEHRRKTGKDSGFRPWRQ